MIYVYECGLCEGQFEVAKSYKDIENPEFCPACGAQGQRIITTVNFTNAGGWDHQGFDHAFGCPIKSHHHRKQLAKERGWEEVGNTDLDKLDKDNAKLREHRKNYRWDRADKD